jgi:hypothetical protein
MVSDESTAAWVNQLEPEDLAFIKRFVLASGSLKELAEAYDITYPTVRLRLDRVIEKIRIFDSRKIDSEFEKTLRASHVDGKIDLDTLRRLLAAHRKEMRKEALT